MDFRRNICIYTLESIVRLALPLVIDRDTFLKIYLIITL